MPTLRHRGLTPKDTVDKRGSWWRLADGERLFDASGGPLLQTLVGVPSPPRSLLGNVSGSADIETPIRRQYEAEILRRAGPSCRGVLWSTSGSDALENALWAIRDGDPRPAVYAVRPGGYHGNTELTRWLSTRVQRGPERWGDGRRVVLAEPWEACDEGVPLKELERLNDRHQVIVVLETVPTTGKTFFPGQAAYRKLLAWSHRRGIAVVLDEVAAGAYRHGWLSAFEWPGAEAPAAVVLSKGLTCGTYPLSCALLRHDIARPLEGRSLPGFTFGLNDPAAWLGSRCLEMFDGLCCSGALARRQQAISEQAQALAPKAVDFTVEHTDTTLRVATVSALAADRLSQHLDGRRIMVYRSAARFGEQVTDFFLFCPPLNLRENLFIQKLRGFTAAVQSA